MALRSLLRVLLVLVVAPVAFARVLSYSPYTNRAAIPAYQLRSASEFVLIEQRGTQFSASDGMDEAEVVVYDVQGAREPRVIFPAAGEPRAPIFFAAYGRNGAVLIQTMSNFQGRNVQHDVITLLGDTTGTSWKRIPELDRTWVSDLLYEDLGGYYTRGLKGGVRPVSSGRYAFVLEVVEGLWGIEPDGKAKRLLESQTSRAMMIGNDATSSRILVRHASRIAILDLETEVLTDLGPDESIGWSPQGWVAGSDRAYVLDAKNNQRSLTLFRKGSAPRLIGAPYPTGTPVQGRDPWSFIAAPTHDYAGAWMIQRDFGKPTTLLRHTEAEGVKTFWSDVTGPQVEALHPGAGGERLLIQVHRPRVQPDRWFIDPALAVWKIGDPAPRDYDELFVAETDRKGFVHLDVDAVAQGRPFVFDSGIGNPPDSRTSPPISGGGDVVQEWGIVRSSLKQELVLPGIARLPGAFNSYWQSDVVLYNPADEDQPVVIRYAPLGGAADLAAKTITLAPREILVVRDALKEWFGVETGGGSLHIEPGAGVMATGRTYTSVAAGTYGFSMAAVDAHTAAGARFPLSFAGAFPGPSFRTNILVTAPKGLVAGARLQAYGVSGEIGADGVTLSTVSSGVWQMNNVHSALSLSSHEEGGLVLRPTHGFVIPAVVAIDNITNDPTYFPPDLPAPVVRTIPVVGHLDGANNSKFRSDLYLLNLSANAQTVRLEAKAWDRSEPPVIVQFTLLPNEDRVIRDVLPRLFGMTGFARLRYMSLGNDGEGVRVTSRTYNLLENGGTLGCLIPPLNSFQAAASGESLEILGVVNDSRFRANIGLVELSPFLGGPVQATAVRIRIIDERGLQIDSFEVTLPAAGGMQINDVLRERGLTAAKAVLIRIEPSGPGLVGAYATLTDNGTNDPSFLAASLGAQE
ncbi:MAG TPA: hypothetical protein VFP80_04920 [Thermoanaerobaculia bacterium]|nr:hypothetical protein [Thermoanaerobaculia bacterium]